MRLAGPLDNSSLLGALLNRGICDRIFVLCLEEQRRKGDATCNDHRRNIWWPSIQQRVTVFPAHNVDHAYAHVLNFSLGARDVQSKKAKTKLRTFLSHLWLVNEAARQNLRSVLIVEADVRQAYMFHPYRSTSQINLLAGRLATALSTVQWSVLRLSAFFADPLVDWPKNATTHDEICKPQCVCRPWAPGALVQDDTLSLCTVAAGPAAATESRLPRTAEMWPFCRAWGSEGYMVHASAFPRFQSTYRWFLDQPALGDASWIAHKSVRGHGSDVPFVDDWLPAVFPNTYVIPSLVTQRGNSRSSRGVQSMRSVHGFRKPCAMMAR